VKTADVGADATGMLEDDALWGDLFAVPQRATRDCAGWSRRTTHA
jgi:hypothetical protein